MRGDVFHGRPCFEPELQVFTDILGSESIQAKLIECREMRQVSSCVTYIPDGCSTEQGFHTKGTVDDRGSRGNSRYGLILC